MAQQVFDAALEFVAPGAPVVATASTTGKAFAPRFNPTCDWVIYVRAMPAGTNETYVFTLEVSDLVAGTYTAIATYNWPRAHGPGKAHIAINADMAGFQDTDCAFMRVTATLAGTAPSVTYGSFLAKAANKLGTAVRVRDIVAV